MEGPNLKVVGKQIIPPFPESNQLAANLRKKLLKNRKRIRQALQPEISSRAKQIIKRKYNQVLCRVQQARSELEKKGISLKNTDDKSFFDQEKQVEKFYQTLMNHLYDVIPELLNQMADKLSKNLVLASKGNLLAKTITLYPSIMGSYLNRPTMKQILTPTVRTLHHLQQQILDNYSETRGSEGSLWVFMYLIFAIFVHLFGKYITRPQKEVIAYILKETFIINVIYMCTSLEINFPDKQLDSIIDKWLEQLKELMSSKMPSL